MKTALTGDEANAQRPQEAYRRSHSKLGQLLEDPYQPSCPCPAPNPLVQVDKRWPPGQIRCTDLSDCKLFFLFCFFFARWEGVFILEFGCLSAGTPAVKQDLWFYVSLTCTALRQQPGHPFLSHLSPVSSPCPGSPVLRCGLRDEDRKEKGLLGYSQQGAWAGGCSFWGRGTETRQPAGMQFWRSDSEDPAG
jgi:hypothetical protein